MATQKIYQKIPEAVGYLIIGGYQVSNNNLDDVINNFLDTADDDEFYKQQSFWIQLCRQNLSVAQLNNLLMSHIMRIEHSFLGSFS